MWAADKWTKATKAAELSLATGVAAESSVMLRAGGVGASGVVKARFGRTGTDSGSQTGADESWWGWGRRRQCWRPKRLCRPAGNLRRCTGARILQNVHWQRGG